MPWSCLCLAAFLRSVEKPLEHNKNKWGERGSLWRIPMDGLMKPEGTLLTKTEDTVEIQP